MTTRFVSIGSLQNVHGYDDAIHSHGIHTDGQMRVEHIPTHMQHVLRKADVAIGGVVDGDVIDIDWNPSNYTPDSSIAEANDVDDLSAHLKGIDDALGGGGTPSGTANRLADYNGSGDLDDVTDLTDYISGTTNIISVTDNGDGTITINGAGVTITTDIVTALRAGGTGTVGLQYKFRSFTFGGGVVSSIGAESTWRDL